MEFATIYGISKIACAPKPVIFWRLILSQLFFVSCMHSAALAETKSPNPSLALPPQITLIDNAGKTQSAVELKPDGTADISATISFGNERLVPKGTKVSLMKFVAGKPQAIAAATTENNGEIVFTGVTEGTYKLGVACDDVSVSEVAVADAANGGNDDSGFASSDSQETISIQDITGVSRVVKELSPGTKAKVVVKNTSESGNGFKGIKARLVTLQNQKRTDVASDADINKAGEAIFKDIPSGTYQVEYDCQNQTQSVSISGKGVLNVLCPVTIAG